MKVLRLSLKQLIWLCKAIMILNVFLLLMFIRNLKILSRWKIERMSLLNLLPNSKMHLYSKIAATSFSLIFLASFILNFDWLYYCFRSQWTSSWCTWLEVQFPYFQLWWLEWCLSDQSVLYWAWTQVINSPFTFINQIINISLTF